MQAEVPDADDPDTQLNQTLIRKLDQADLILIAGEASSHCVTATTEHIVENLPAGRLERVEKPRVETARALIEDGHSIERVAEKTGFSDPERMRRAFHRAFGQPPQALRRAARLHGGGVKGPAQSVLR